VVAVGDVDGHVVVWRGDTVRRVQLMQTAITGLAFDSSGRLVVTHHGGEVWRLPADPADTAAPEQLIADPTRIFQTAWLSPSGRWLMMPDDTGYVIIHDLLHRARPRVLRGLYAETATPFTADESAVVLGDARGLVEVWELETGRKRGRFVGRGLRPDVIAVLPDDRFVLVDRRGVSVVDARDGVSTGGLAPCTGAVVTGRWKPDGSGLVIACGEGEVRHYDARGTLVSAAILGAPPTVLAVDDLTAAAGDAEGHVLIGDGQPFAAHASAVTGLVLAGGAVISAAHDGSIRAVSREGAARWDRDLGGEARALAASPDGAQLAAVVVERGASTAGAVGVGQLVILDAATGTQRAAFELELHGVGDAVAWPRADRLIVSGFLETAIIAADGTRVTTVPGRAAAPGRLDSNADRFVVAHSSGPISTYDLDGNPILRHSHHGGAATSANLGRDGTVASAAVDGTIVRVDEAGAPLQRVARDSAATWVAAAPDEAVLAVGYDDGTVHLEPLTDLGGLERGCDVVALFGETRRVQGYCDSGRTDSSR
jgi:WD40 repeat protein